MKILGTACGIPREAKDKKVLDADYKNHLVFFGRKIAGGFDSNGQFEIKVANIDQEARRLGKAITGEQIKDTFENEMRR